MKFSRFLWRYGSNIFVSFSAILIELTRNHVDLENCAEIKRKLYIKSSPILWKNFSSYFLKIVRNISKNLEMFFKFTEVLLKFHYIILIGNDFQISPTISIKFVEKFSLIYTKLLKITKKNSRIF